ncbi:Hsp70 family protein [Dactylosporangium sp. CA-092794]|uniref:Hsp70 family protein n=1 Tax=Dactylosporangium sp. CA-092794 TaxID=3239929 RepID=UPI003D8C923A
MADIGIDLGSSSTVAFLRRDDGTTEPVLFDGVPLLPSAVFAGPGGELLAGRDAVHSARAHPERFEGNPKRRIDEGRVFLGAEVPVEALLGALLRRVAAEAHRVAGVPVAAATVCHPAAWGPGRRSTLWRAAAGAGLGEVRLVPEPVAAAAFHLRRHGAISSDLLVYDLGAGTFDVAVVRHDPRPGGGAAMQVLCSAGLDDTGGQDVDAAIVGLLRARGGAPELWRRLDEPATVADRAARRQLWEDVRGAKEMLSRTSSATVYLPLLDTSELLTRDELERLAAPLIQRTVNAIGVTLAACPVPLRPLGAVILVGGASRMPLVATMLHRALHIAPTVIDQPELVVAAGSVDPLLTGLGAPPPRYAPPPTPAPAPPYAPPVPAGPPAPVGPGVPVTGPARAQEAGLVLTVVEVIELNTPGNDGVTLRGQLHGGYGVVEYVFPTDGDGNLLLFADTMALARYAARDASDPLVATPPWRVRNDGADERRYDLDLLAEHLAAPPEEWLPSYLCRCRDVCAQLAVFLGLDGADDLIGEHSTIDRADEILRRHRTQTIPRAAARRLAKLDRAQLVEDWTDLLALIDAAVSFQR